MAALHVETAGDSGPTLVLLHGLGVNGAVWRPLIEVLDWPGRVVVPDFRGHGRSPHGGPYSHGAMAADIAALIGDEPVHLVGHSMGGMVALMLASGWFGGRVASVFAFGVKIAWTAAEIDGARAVAAKPVRWFDTRAEAAERFLKVGGLFGLVDADAAVVDAGLVEQGGRWRLAADPETMNVVGLALDGVKAAILPGTPVRLGGGGRDPMVAAEAVRRFDPQAAIFGDCGHNPHVEAPGQLAQAVRATTFP